MIGPFRWAIWVVRNAPQLARTVSGDPIGALLWARDQLVERREYQRPPCPYEAEPEWERKLHAILRAPWPCAAAAEFWTLWPEVMRPFEAKGTRIGRGEFAGWGDGEPGLVRAVWCLVRHLRPVNVVETGVGRGFTSRFILEGLERNGVGHLWSIDFPPVRAPEFHAQIGAAVTLRLRHRWSYIKGTSRQHLPKLLARLGQIDLFIHDSRHTEDNLMFELNQAWASLRPGGFVVADDIDYNWAFLSFGRAVAGHPVLNCYAEPLRPDPTRFEAKGLFGVAQKKEMTAAS